MFFYLWTYIVNVLLPKNVSNECSFTYERIYWVFFYLWTYLENVLLPMNVSSERSFTYERI